MAHELEHSSRDRQHQPLEAPARDVDARHVPLTRAEKRRRLVGNANALDIDDVHFWRNATDAERGRALYSLLVFADNVLRSRLPRSEEVLTFPGFPIPRRGATAAEQ